MTILRTFRHVYFRTRSKADVHNMANLSKLQKVIGIVLVVFSMSGVAVHAQSFTTLINFNFTDGYDPIGELVQGIDGNLYGTTSGGGGNNSGTVFKISPAEVLTMLYSFENGVPLAGLVQDTNGNFYGTTTEAGANGEGEVFEITAAGELTTLYSFCSQPNCNDGSFPYAGTLIQGMDGNLYGTTLYGGTSDDGTVFKMTPTGELTTLHSFDGSDGYGIFTGLIQGTDDSFYGVTAYGGSHSDGTLYRIAPAGKLTTLYSFCSQPKCADGSAPVGVIQAIDGNFYGTTQDGGSGAYKGTVFKITAKGELTTLYSFCLEAGCPDGSNPNSGLVQGSDGNFYGTTGTGGASNDGTLFEITPGGAFTTLHSFDGSDGSIPYAGLLQGTNGSFYGTTAAGGTDSDGTLFKLSVVLGPFVETRLTSGKVGGRVIILGNNLEGATSVAFNGTHATFKVVSNTEIETTVPMGATTGTVEVTTRSGGTLSSNVPFRVGQ